MMGFNHALVGGLIGKFLPLPIGVPVSLASHFLIDTLPHYGLPQKQRDKSLFWKIFFYTDFFATLFLGIFALHKHHYAMLLCGCIAVAPDFVWVARLVRTKSFDMSRNSGWYTKWHAGIQHFEFAKGKFIEIPLAAVLLYFLLKYLNS